MAPSTKPTLFRSRPNRAAFLWARLAKYIGANKGDHQQMRIRFLIFVCLSFVAGAHVFAQQTAGKPQPAPAAPQASPKPHGPARIVTRTRLVSIFSAMENQLFSAVQKKDKAALTQMVTDDFSIWMPNETGDPFPLDDWLQSIATDYNLKSFKIT